MEALDQQRVAKAASIIAASVLGRIDSHSISPPVSRSSAVGVTIGRSATTRRRAC